MAYHHKSGAQKRKVRKDKFEKSQKNQLTLEDFCTKKSKKKDIKDRSSVSCGNCKGAHRKILKGGTTF
jgi:hypothetical protein